MVSGFFPVESGTDMGGGFTIVKAGWGGGRGIDWGDGWGGDCGNGLTDDWGVGRGVCRGRKFSAPTVADTVAVAGCDDSWGDGWKVGLDDGLDDNWDVGTVMVAVPVEVDGSNVCGNLF